ncbi:MAG TPA: ABC transporter ATP-binding protein [Alloiococcus sp.]|nr:ABC transporter ATP-binding protein [Alloiococcus sp.]
MSENRRLTFPVKTNIKVMMRLFTFAKPYWKLFTVAIFMMLISSGVSALMPIVIQRYIDNHLTNSGFEWTITTRFALFYFILVLVKSGLTYFSEYWFMNSYEMTIANLRRQVYRKVNRLSMRYFDQTPNGSIVSRITNDTETIKEFWKVFLQMADGLFNAISIAIAMFSLNVQYAMIFIAFVPVVLLLMYTYQKYSTIIYGRMREALSKVNTELSESISGMSTIQHFNQEERKKKEFDLVSQEYVDARIRMFKMNAVLLMPAINFIEAIVLVILLSIFGIQFFNDMAVNVGIVYAFTSYTRSFFRPIGNMINSLSIYQDGIVAGYRVIKLMDRDDLAPTESENATGEITNGKIEMNNVTFSYDGKRDVLKNINIKANPGETIALVGQTGSGKSSIINLLMRFYEFNQGEILIDDQSIKNIKDHDLRQKFGLVLQDSYMFYGNIRDNISMFKDFSDEEIRQAAEFVNADKIIEKLDDGYDSKVIERGAAFSTGEKQLLSFARTILRKPKILILDEATANIDTETEQMIQDGLKKMRRGRTTIMIAHRLSTIKDADNIYVLRHGEIIEEGTHDELIAKEGMYYNMYILQTSE